MIVLQSSSFPGRVKKRETTRDRPNLSCRNMPRRPVLCLGVAVALFIAKILCFVQTAKFQPQRPDRRHHVCMSANEFVSMAQTILGVTTFDENVTKVALAIMEKEKEKAIMEKEKEKAIMEKEKEKEKEIAIMEKEKEKAIMEKEKEMAIMQKENEKGMAIMQKENEKEKEIAIMEKENEKGMAIMQKENEKGMAIIEMENSAAVRYRHLQYKYLSVSSRFWLEQLFSDFQKFVQSRFSWKAERSMTKINKFLVNNDTVWQQFVANESLSLTPPVNESFPSIPDTILYGALGEKVHQPPGLAVLNLTDPPYTEHVYLLRDLGVHYSKKLNLVCESVDLSQAIGDLMRRDLK